MGFTRPQSKSVRLINGTLGGSVSARVANGELARPARSLVLRGPGRRRLGQGEQGAGSKAVVAHSLEYSALRNALVARLGTRGEQRRVALAVGDRLLYGTRIW